MKLLFVQQNCPGQFKNLAPHFAAAAGNEVVFVTQPGKPGLARVRKIGYKPARQPADSTHRYLRSTGQGVPKMHKHLPLFFAELREARAGAVERPGCLNPTIWDRLNPP